MLTSSLLFSSISIYALFLYSYPYVKDILAWQTIPHPFTFSVFFILTSINASILYSESHFYALVPIIAELLLFIVYIYFGCRNFKKIKNTSMFDIICFILAISCILIFIFFWVLEAIIATMIVDTIALLPTLKKVYFQPHTETAVMWAWSACFFLFLLLTIKDYTWQNTLFWIYLFFADAFTAAYVVFFQKFKK